MKNRFSLLGLFGGTFDPMHNGHLAVVTGLLELLPFKAIHLMPCGIPPHKNMPIANAKQRYEMIKIAIEAYPKLVANDIEVRKQQPSYTLETLKELKKQYPNKALCLILATDAFASLNQWHQWHQLLDYCHLIIVERPQFSLPDTKWAHEFLEKTQTRDPQDLNRFQTGKVLFQRPTPSKMTATDIRHQLSLGQFKNISGLLNPKVISYIKKFNLYI